MLILAISTDVEVHLGSIAQTLEEVEEHLCGHFAYLLTIEFGIPYQPRTTTEIEGYAAQTVVHGQAISVALYAALVAKSLQQTLAQGQCRVLDSVMLVNVQVAVAAHSEVYLAVLADLFQHVVEESQSRLYVATPATVQIYSDEYVRLFCRALHLGSAFASESDGGSPLPRGGSLGVSCCTVYLQELTANVFCKFAVGLAIANHVAVGNVILRVVHILPYQSRIGLAGRGIVLREMWIDEYLVKLHTLAFQRVEDEVVNRPESVLRETVGAQTVLVADHHKLVVSMLAQEGQAADSMGYEFQFLKRVYLLVLRLLYDGAVAVDEEYLFHFVVFSVLSLKFCVNGKTA